MNRELTIDTNWTLYEALQNVIRQYPEREALVMGETRLTYHQLGERVDALAAGLRGLGLGDGDKVATILPTSLESVYSLIAPEAIGAAAVPMNPALRAHEVRHILADSGAVALITVTEMFGHDYLQMIEAIRPALPALRHVIVKGGAREGTSPLEEVMAQGEAASLTEGLGDPEAMACLIYTSGTTGTPKGAVHSHRNLLLGANVMVEAIGAEVWEVNLIPVPLFHIGGIGLVLITLFIGGKVVLMERFDPQQALQTVETERVTFIAGVPIMYQAMLGFPRSEQYNLSSLRMAVAGGAPVPPSLLQALRERASCVVFNGYGSTEAGLISLTRPDDSEETQLTTVGRPGPGVDIRIVDDDRQDVPLGQAGEIATRAPFIMQGYYNRPQETTEVMDEDGWYYTGDIGSLDEDGYLRILDRKRDLIIRGGANIYPAEIENYLVTHPKIQMAAVIGVPRPVGGERVRAYILPMPGAELTETEVLNYCRGQIAMYKLPEEVRFVESFPLTALRKVQKFKLCEEAGKELEVQSA